MRRVKDRVKIGGRMSSDATHKAASAKREILDRISSLESSLGELRRELASTADKSDATTFDVLTFAVHERHYAVFLNDVAEVLRMVKYSPLPKAPPDIQGVINCRGVMLPILNPGAIFSTEAIQSTLNAALVVVSAAGQRVAIIVEQVLGVQTFMNKELDSVSEEQSGHRTLPPFILGFIKHAGGHISLVDVNQLLRFEDRRALETALRERDEWGQG